MSTSVHVLAVVPQPNKYHLTTANHATHVLDAPLAKFRLCQKAMLREAEKDLNPSGRDKF